MRALSTDNAHHNYRNKKPRKTNQTKRAKLAPKTQTVQNHHPLSNARARDKIKTIRGGIMSVSVQPRLVAPSAVREAISFADAALALAGHTVTDAHIRDLLEQCLSGQISDAEYLAQAIQHIRRTRTR